jgi:histidine ammonia-lyase
VYETVREVSPYVERDRELREDIARVVELVRSGAQIAAVEGG